MEQKTLTKGEMVLALADLRTRYRNSTDQKEREAITEQARNYICTYTDTINGQTVQCKNARRSGDSQVCERHIWVHGSTRHRKLTIHEMQEKLYAWAHEGEQVAAPI